MIGFFFKKAFFDGWDNLFALAAYNIAYLALAAIFAVVGGIFLLIPESMLSFFNGVARRLGMIEGPTGPSFFGALAGAYMYVVTALAWLMYRRPGERIYARLLGQAKLASAALSFLLFALQSPWLIWLVNGLVDAALGVLVLAMSARMGRAAAAADGRG
jgi:hypothetical protein